MSRAPSRSACVDGGADHVAGLAQELLGFGGVHPAPCLDHRRAAERHPRWRSTVTTTITTPSSASFCRSRSTPWLDVPHGAVDVDVAGRDLAVADDALGVELRRRRRPRTAAPWPASTPMDSAEAGVVHHVPVLAVHGHEALRPGHRHQRAQLPLAGVAR